MHITLELNYLPKPISSSDSSSGSSFFFSSFAGAASALTGATAAGAMKDNKIGK